MDTILESLKNKGYRVTRLRAEIVSLLSNTKKPLTAIEIKTALERGGLKPNKTTVYREISTLKSEGIIHEIVYGDARVHYKICPAYNHIHLVCLKCHNVDEIKINDLSRYNKLAFKEKGFECTGYGIELFGICKKCKQSRMEESHEADA